MHTSKHICTGTAKTLYTIIKSIMMSHEKPKTAPPLEISTRGRSREAGEGGMRGRRRKQVREKGGRRAWRKGLVMRAGKERRGRSRKRRGGGVSKQTSERKRRGREREEREER